jgi:hypothetical protein
LAQGPQPPTPPRAPSVSGGLIFGGNIVVESGTAADDTVLFGGNATIRNGGSIGDIVLFGGNLTVEAEGFVRGDAVLFGGNVDMAGTIDGDVVLIGGNLNLKPTAIVKGNVRLVGGHINRSAGAVIRGSVTEETRWNPRINLGPPFINDPFITARNFGNNLLNSFITTLALAALGVLVLAFFPQPTRRVMDTAQSATLPSFGVGCLTIIVGGVLMIGLTVTLIGIPLTVLLGLTMAATWFFGWIALGYLIGEKVLQGLKVRDIAPMLAMVFGVILIGIIGQAPCVGLLASLLLGTLGVGAVVLTRFGTRLYPQASSAQIAPIAPLTPTSPMTGEVTKPTEDVPQ